MKVNDNLTQSWNESEFWENKDIKNYLVNLI